MYKKIVLYNPQRHQFYRGNWWEDYIHMCIHIHVIHHFLPMSSIYKREFTTMHIVWYHTPTSRTVSSPAFGLAFMRASKTWRLGNQRPSVKPSFERHGLLATTGFQHVCIYIYIHSFIYMCIYIYIFTYVYINMFTYMYIYTCLHMYIYIYIHMMKSYRYK